jgi:hypothetical protein
MVAWRRLVMRWRCYRLRRLITSRLEVLRALGIR